MLKCIHIIYSRKSCVYDDIIASYATLSAATLSAATNEVISIWIISLWGPKEEIY